MADSWTFDHVRVTVADLGAAIDVCARLGLEGRTTVEGDFLDTVVGLCGVRGETAVLRPPGDGTALELSTFVRPDHVADDPDVPVTRLGLRNVCFVVDDLQTVRDPLAADGSGLLGGVGDTRTPG